MVFRMARSNIHVSCSSSACGVAILISPEIDIVVHSVDTDSDGRFILLNTTFEGQNLIIVNIYSPTKDKPSLQKEFLNFVHEKLIVYMDKHILLGGDFNICLQPEVDKKGGAIEKQSESALLIEAMMDEIDLVDSWRLFNPDSPRREMTRNGNPD